MFDKLDKYRSEYICSILQIYIPSVLFLYGATRLHGHVRNIGVVSRDGDVTYIGYIVKLTTLERANSSAFRSYVLVYDSSEKLVYGLESSKAWDLKYSLADLHLTEAVDINSVLKESRWRWYRAMYIINAFIDSPNWYNEISKMIDSGLLSQKYKL